MQSFSIAFKCIQPETFPMRLLNAILKLWCHHLHPLSIIQWLYIIIYHHYADHFAFPAQMTALACCLQLVSNIQPKDYHIMHNKRHTRRSGLVEDMPSPSLLFLPRIFGCVDVAYEGVCKRLAVSFNGSIRFTYTVVPNAFSILPLIGWYCMP